MTTDPPTSDPSQRRRLGILVLGIAVALSALFVTFAVWTKQPWMLAFLVLIIPNVYVAVRELRGSRPR